MPKKSKKKLSDELREYIESSGKSRYPISKETGIAEETLSRFVNRKGGLSMEGIDKLAECLGIGLIQCPSDELLREMACDAETLLQGKPSSNPCWEVKMSRTIGLEDV